MKNYIILFLALMVFSGYGQNTKKDKKLKGSSFFQQASFAKLKDSVKIVSEINVPKMKLSSNLENYSKKKRKKKKKKQRDNSWLQKQLYSKSVSATASASKPDDATAYAACATK